MSEPSRAERRNDVIARAIGEMAAEFQRGVWSSPPEINLDAAESIIRAACEGWVNNLDYTREVQAAMERAAGELLREREQLAHLRRLHESDQQYISRLVSERDRERELADTLGRALEQLADEGDGRHSTDAWVAADEALRQWREARKAPSGS